ncbi:unnamed protein product [Auanema sp. JU1783]|nr:unnamed protein product [Auanema sp. JU1783]
MDSYTLNQLTEEVFGHLCNIAIDKCNDKMEKRRAGCGGSAMRKRVLIKNFVSDLLKSHGEKVTEDDTNDYKGKESLSNHLITSSYDYNLNQVHFNGDGSTHYIRYMDDMDSSEASLCDVDDSDINMELLDEHDIPKNDCWLSSGCIDSNQYHDYTIGSSFLSGRDGAESRAEIKSPLDCLDDSDRLSIYDCYSSISESATEGGSPESSLPLPSMPAHGFESAYDLSMTSSYELEPLSALSTLCDVGNSSPLQPVRAEPSDQLFLSLNNNCYSEMKTYTPLMEKSSDDVMSPPHSECLTDLDAINPLVSPKKRKSSEFLFLGGVDASHQKRLKL